MDNIEVTGMGIVSPIGIGWRQFSKALEQGETNFCLIGFKQPESVLNFPIGMVKEFNFKELVASIPLDAKIIDRAKRLRNISQSIAFGIYCTLEAWADAGLATGDIDLSRVALVSGGSNYQQASFLRLFDDYRDKLAFINPNHALNFLDTDIIGVLSELLGIQGEGHSIGAASASGNMAIIQGHRLISANDYDIVVVVAPLMDLSMYEYQAFTALGAMAAVSGQQEPVNICRPFDATHSGFVYGQCAGCIILESADHAAKRDRRSYGAVAGYGVSLDANRNPNPSLPGEKKAMQNALAGAGVDARQIDYVNTHGTASVIGDQIEVEAMLAVGLEGVKANSTKSLVGHGISAAGLVETIACLVQMNGRFLHKSHNLTNPITDQIDWIKATKSQVATAYCMNNSFGFGGINTSIILKNKHL